MREDDFIENEPVEFEPDLPGEVPPLPEEPRKPMFRLPSINIPEDLGARVQANIQGGDMDDLFEVPEEDDNDMYVDDLFEVDGEDLEFDTDISDIVSVSREDVIGRKPTRRIRRPDVGYDSLGGTR